jgi:biopolymer transport protein ExbD
MAVRRRKRPTPFVPVAAMGDIAFLLIIFFMVATNFARESHVRLDPAASPDIDTIKEAPLSVSIDKDGQVWFQGKPCEAESLEGVVRTMLPDREDKTVMLKIDKELTQERFGEAIVALSRAGAQIALVGVKAREQR